MWYMKWRMVRSLTEEKIDLREVYDKQSSDADVLELEDKKTATNVLINCDNVVKIYKTKELEVMALQGLDFQVNEGELLAIIGKSGSGKSTLMNIIGGLEKPTAGSCSISGYNIHELSEKEMVEYRKKTVGFVWQKSARNLFPYLTATENIELPMEFSGRSGKEKRKRALMLLDMVGLSHKKDSYPGQMSGGEQQRVAIAVALANEPKILLADEPTGAVDTKTSNQIQDMFRKLNRELGITIIIVTHDPKLANKVDRVIMIADGKISTEKIIKQHYREMLEASENDEFMYEDSHDEYSVLDKAHRVQLTDDMLEAAGIDSNKVKISIVDGKIVISNENT